MQPNRLYGFIAACLLSIITDNANAMDADKTDIDFIKKTKKPKSLVIGCRPWDENLRGLSLTNVHFVDFRIQRDEYDDSKWIRSYVPQPDHIPSTFHHLNLNDVMIEESEICKGPLAGKFSQFAQENPGEFHDIIIDWGTYHHIKREEAWSNLATLLAPGRNLVIPVTRMSTQTDISQSEEKAKELKNIIAPFFSNITIISYDVLNEQNQTYQGLSYKQKFNMTDVSLLCRPYISDDAKTFTPAIIFATK